MSEIGKLGFFLSMRSTLRIPWLYNFARIGYGTYTFIVAPFIQYITVKVPFAPLMLLAITWIDLLSWHLQEYNQNIQRQYLLVSLFTQASLLAFDSNYSLQYLSHISSSKVIFPSKLDCWKNHIHQYSDLANQNMHLKTNHWSVE